MGNASHQSKRDTRGRGVHWQVRHIPLFVYIQKQGQSPDSLHGYTWYHTGHHKGAGAKQDRFIEGCKHCNELKGYKDKNTENKREPIRDQHSSSRTKEDTVDKDKTQNICHQAEVGLPEPHNSTGWNTTTVESAWCDYPITVIHHIQSYQ